MRILKIVSFVFSTVGVLLLVGSVFVYTNTSRFIRGAAEVEGKVVGLARSVGSSGSVGSSRSGSTYHPVVEFTSATGKQIEFTSGVGSNPPSHQVGETVAVLYDPANPYSARIKSFFSLWFAFLIVFVLGAVFSSIGLSMIALRSRGRKQAEWLHRNGRRMQTTFKTVELNQALRVNGRSPYHILSQSIDPASKTVRVFKSENIWFDPSEYITRETIDVLVDPGNPQKYVMDIGFLPKSE